MSDHLTLDMAISFAESLTTIGHPMLRGAILATASDLMEWCQGVILPGPIVLSAEQQAYQLCAAARKWSEGWPDRGGTAKLYELFQTLFVPRTVKPGNAAVDYANEPCTCGSGKKFKECCRGKSAEEIAAWIAELSIKSRPM